LIDVFLAIACSVLVSVLLRLARRFDADVGQAIAWNYAVASVLVALVLRPDVAALRNGAVPWLALIGLGLLLPTIFLALGASVRHAGIVRSDAAQRLSLLLSLPAAFVLFGESLRPGAAIGIVLGLLALPAMLWRTTPLSPEPASTRAARWLYPLLVLAGFGVIDILFKRVAQAGVPLATSLQAMFALALPVAFGLALWRRWRDGTRFTARSLIGGVLLGLFNFGNILFYLRGHRALPQHPALVFASMNIGVVALGALVGMALFRERLSRLNLAGVLLAALAIGWIAWP
jgi:drug/metabolite transporter (DMT)-like permease